MLLVTVSDENYEINVCTEDQQTFLLLSGVKIRSLMSALKINKCFYAETDALVFVQSLQLFSLFW